MPVDDYLAQELVSEVRHEYVAGAVYAKAGARIRHNRIVQAINGSLFQQLRGQRCESFNSDMKVRIQLPSHTRFYYPDGTVVCRSNPESDSFQDEPRLVFEVLSQSTRRLDLGEKRDGYLSIPSLALYLMVEQSVPLVVLNRRTERGFEREVYEGLETVIALPEIGCQLFLSEVYERMTFEEDEASEGPVSQA